MEPVWTSGQMQAIESEGFADLPTGARIWYSDTGGSGAPVVFLHAATGSSKVWEHQIPAFTASGFRVVTYDRRGFGQYRDRSGGRPARYRARTISSRWWII